MVLLLHLKDCFSTYLTARVIDKYHLLTARGYGARITELDIWKLTLYIRAMPQYKQVKLTETNKESNLGVPTKNQMRLLRAAMKRGQRGHKQAAYSPSPRIEIF